MTEQEQRARVVSIARSWIGTPYHHHARLKGIGVDCAQLLCAVFEEAGLVDHVETGHYPHDWHLHRSEELFLQTLRQFARECDDGRELAPGDVLVWHFGRTFSHGSIYVGDGLFAHAYIDLGVVLSRAHEVPLVCRAFKHWSFW